MAREFGLDWQDMPADRALALMEVMAALERPRGKNVVDGRERLR